MTALARTGTATGSTSTSSGIGIAIATRAPTGAPSPSPSKSNPFARPKSTHQSSFHRTSILPTLPSPIKANPSLENAVDAVDHLSTPADKLLPARTNASTSASVLGSASKRAAWRLLWRGGLEIGHDGWRLDGITFFALLNFGPPTPSASAQATPNPFDFPISNPSPNPTSPFPLPGGDTDLCLSLESMRGRKYLQVRGIADLGEDEALESSDTSDESGRGGVQISIAPTAPLLAAYFTSLLCRHLTLSPSGRTLSAIIIGLGDEGVDSPGSTVLIYGQRDLTISAEGQATPSLRLCVGRRRAVAPTVTEKKVRPGEPLPRPTLFFPAKAPKKPPPPFPRRSRSGSGSLSRAPSVSSIYHPPPPTLPYSHPHAHSQTHSHTQQQPSKSLPPAPVSGRTPGRRGEKRPRPSGGDDDRRRKAGRIIVDRDRLPISSREDSAIRGDNDGGEGTHHDFDSRDERKGVGGSIPSTLSPKAVVAAKVEGKTDDEDIFGKRASSMAPPQGIGINKVEKGSEAGDNTPAGQKKRRVPQQVLDNKATIRKQTMVILEERGYARDHPLFKDVFGMTTKGVYFAFRDELEFGPLIKTSVQSIIKGHLDMYLPSTAPETTSHRLEEVKEEPEDLFEGEGEGDDRVDRDYDRQNLSSEPGGLTGLSEGVESDGIVLSEADFEVKQEEGEEDRCQE